MRHWKYFKYVFWHKWYVFLACVEMAFTGPDIDLFLAVRLIWRGVIHDLSKFHPREWFPYANFDFDKDREKGYMHELDPEELEFNIAWNHHQKRNDHHWQYWVLFRDEGEHYALPMSNLAKREMIADWRGAGMAQGKPNTWEWWLANRDKILLHHDTRMYVDWELSKMMLRVVRSKEREEARNILRRANEAVKEGTNEKS